MTYEEQIHQLWSDNSQDLATILQHLLQLLVDATDAGESISPELELEIVLQANYALNYGSTLDQVRHLARLYYRLINLSADFSEFGIAIDRFQRLGCTLAAAILSLASSTDDQHNAIYSVPCWEEFLPDSPLLDILGSVLSQLVAGLDLGSVNNWTYELLTFILTYHLLHQDLEGTGLDGEAFTKVQTFVKQLDRESSLWTSWRSSWLEYSDYYRFVTLLLTNTSSSEEIWLDELQILLS